MTYLYVVAGLVTAFLLLIVVMVRMGRNRTRADQEIAHSQTAAGCTMGVQLMIDELVERYGLTLADVLVAARAAQAAYENLDNIPGWPGHRLAHGVADGRTLLMGIQVYCTEQDEAILRPTRTAASSR